MLNINEIPKVLIQDAVIIAMFLLLACGISKLEVLLGTTTSFVIFVITWPVLFILLFYSNAGLLKNIKNNYAWSMGSGIPSILITTGAVMFAVHNTCGSSYAG